ncbi:MAG: sn-glycerol-3-phosphate ABC transporter ATP-binding protein UgpC [Methylacidiphilales bacterium]|nr:sn-glycerol-3-phosphate ABC transporter ATP-binding protein UgpC [Candidatus Methylacidiphilales bacterium]
MAKVILENVHKTYAGDKGREIIAVEDASLTIEDKEFMVFVGPSGCGKSTTLRMIAGLEEITRGAVYIDGKKVNDVAPKDRDIAMVFQNYALYPHMTAYKNMAFGLQLRNYPKAEIESRVSEAAQILGLTKEMLDRRPKALSGGQRQRVALGRAIVRKPKVFLFDEPLSNLDAKMRVQMRTEISKLHRRLATTMIYVTHDQVEAMTMGDRICLMKDGRIQQVAQPLEIYNQPANMFVAAFIGSPPMNFFEGKLVQKEGRLFFSGKKSDADPGGIMLPVEEGQTSRLQSRLNEPIYLGLRPEDIDERSGAGEGQSGQIFRAVVDWVESMGPETFFHLKTGTHSFTVRSSGQVNEQTDQKIDLVANMEKARFFEAVSQDPYKKETGQLDLEKWQTACRRIV